MIVERIIELVGKQSGREADMSNVATFESVLEKVELLPDEDQEVLVGLIQQRLAARRRAAIAANIAETRAEYKAGTVKRGTAADLLAELDE